MYCIINYLNSIDSKIIELLNSVNDYKGDIISAVINSIGIIIAVLIGIESIKKKIAENHFKDLLSKVEENNNFFNEKINEVLIFLESKVQNSFLLHYKEVEKFYNKQMKDLTKMSINASSEISTGCYILERYTNLLLKLRVPYKYQNYPKIKQYANVDSKYFLHIYNFLMKLSYFSHNSVSVPNYIYKKKTIFDPIQKQLGGPDKNYERKNIIANINGIVYDPRYSLYYDFYKQIANTELDSIRAFANILQDRIIFPVSKFLVENKIYAPLFIQLKSNFTYYPCLYLSGFKFQYEIGNVNNSSISFYYINTINWCFFEQNINDELLKGQDLELFIPYIDKKFLKISKLVSVSSLSHSIEIKIKKQNSEQIFKKNKFRILKQIKKLHKGD